MPGGRPMRFPRRSATERIPRSLRATTAVFSCEWCSVVRMRSLGSSKARRATGVRYAMATSALPRSSDASASRPRSKCW